MRLTQRAHRAIVGLAIVGGFGAGLTAQAWNPYTRAVDGVGVVQISAPVEEDQVQCAGTPEQVVTFERSQDGSAAVGCAVSR